MKFIIEFLKRLFHSHEWDAIGPTGTVSIMDDKREKQIGTATILTKKCRICGKVETDIFNKTTISGQ